MNAFSNAIITTYPKLNMLSPWMVVEDINFRV